MTTGKIIDSLVDSHTNIKLKIRLIYLVKFE